MTQQRVYLLIAGLGLGVMAAVGALNTPARSGGELRDFDWGDDVTGRAMVSAIRVVRAFDADERRLSYYTGGYSPAGAESSAAPRRVIAEAADGAVTVRLRAFDPYARENAGADAAKVARIVSLATTLVWPAQPTPVEVDVHFMPERVSFSLAKPVDWREGDPYTLAVFTGEDWEFDPSTAAHELYHVLAARWSLGKHAPRNSARRAAANAYEETAATLLATCGLLLANGSLARDPPSFTMVIREQRFEGLLDGEELGRAIDLLRDVPAAQALRGLLAATVVEHVSGGEETIVLGSPQAERVLGRCRESAANPMLLGFRFAEMVEASTSELEPRALEN